MKKTASFSTKIDLSLKDKLYTDLQSQGFTFSKPPYSVFSAKKKNINCTLYESGSLVVQGKEKDEFIEFYLEPEILKDFSYTHPTAKMDFSERIGVDEAGKGDFFGPLCTCALYANQEMIQKLADLGVRDSKTFGDTKILKLASSIKKVCPHANVKLFPETYNRLYYKFNNLNLLLGWCHATAIEDIVKKTSCQAVLIDQFAQKHVVENAIKRKKLELHLTQKHRGEEDIVVAAASIMARACFLEGMERLSNDISYTLPKGASKQVIIAGKNIVVKHGVTILPKIAKMHFKTKEQIIAGL